jgi:hypothetical protein
MDNNTLINDLKKELAELRKLYQEAKRNELMYQNMLHFILDSEVPESKLTDFKARIA